ncbi:MAG: ribbon-helix-helix protein, CopG family [Acetobacter orientalis]|uniref:ribbon-helix-helix protein, CopG family n=1 Tax=Acetobacter orientalis TaxID=146474 RepID=UPI0039E76F8B
MSTSIKKAIPKKRGRPATGKDPMLAGRVPAEMIEAVERWAAQHNLTRSEAIRRLIQLGLDVECN